MPVARYTASYTEDLRFGRGHLSRPPLAVAYSAVLGEDSQWTTRADRPLSGKGHSVHTTLPFVTLDRYEPNGDPGAHERNPAVHRIASWLTSRSDPDPTNLLHRRLTVPIWLPGDHPNAAWVTASSRRK